MKRLILTVLFLAGSLVCLSAQQLRDLPKIGLVDMNRVMVAFSSQSEDVRAFIERRNKFEEEMKKQNEELQELLQELPPRLAEAQTRLEESRTKLAEAQEQKNREQIRNLESQIKALESQIKTDESKIQSKEQAVRNYVNSNLTALARERDQLLRNDDFRRRLNIAIRGVAESEGYSLVMSMEGTNILWYSNSMDITGRVIERIRSGGARR